MGKFVVKIDEDLKSLIPEFVKNREKDVIELRQFVTQKDLKGIQSIAHKMSGNAGSYGFDGLGDIAKIMEEAAKNGNEKVIQEEIEKMKEYLDNMEIKYVEEEE